MKTTVENNDGLSALMKINTWRGKFGASLQDLKTKSRHEPKGQILRRKKTNSKRIAQTSAAKLRAEIYQTQHVAEEVADNTALSTTHTEESVSMMEVDINQ